MIGIGDILKDVNNRKLLTKLYARILYLSAKTNTKTNEWFVLFSDIFFHLFWDKAGIWQDVQFLELLCQNELFFRKMAFAIFIQKSQKGNSNTIYIYYLLFIYDKVLLKQRQ